MSQLPANAFIHVSKKAERSVVFDTYANKTFEIPYLVGLKAEKNELSQGEIEKITNHLSAGSLYLANPASRASHLFELRLLVTNKCDFRCTYCFANHGSYDMPLQTMTTEVATRAVDYFFSRFDSIHQISFFGGEPLLAADVIDQTCQYVRSSYPNQSIAFSIMTNASQLYGDVASMLDRNNISVVASIDGPKCLNDLNRVKADGSGTFEITDTNIRNYAKSHSIAIEATYTMAHVAAGMSREELADYLTNRYGTSRIKVADASCTKNNKWDAGFNPLEEAAKAMLKRFLESEEHPYDDYAHLLMRYFLFNNNSRYFCDAGAKKYAVDMNGDIFPCHEFVGEKGYALGNVRQTNDMSGILVPDKLECGCVHCPYCMYCTGCVCKIIKDGKSCGYVKECVELFLHGVLEIILTDKDEYRFMVDRWYQYGYSNSLRRKMQIQA